MRDALLASGDLDPTGQHRAIPAAIAPGSNHR
jgi:hypothetical protein